MRVGICKLCLQKRDLQNSHFLPRGMYKKLRSQGKGNNDPCIVTARDFRRSSGQYTGYVFCKECEKRLNVRGENYAMRILPPPGKRSFPLLEMLDAARPGWQRE